MARTAEVKRDARIGEGTLSNQLFVGASKQKVDSSQHNTIKDSGETDKEMYQISFCGRLSNLKVLMEIQSR